MVDRANAEQLAQLAELAQRAEAGDAEALRKLIELSWPFLLSYLRSLTAIRWLGKDEDHAHNVVSNVIARLHEPAALQTFRQGQGDFRRWLATVAHRLAIDYVRELVGRKPRGKPVGNDGEPSAKALLNLFATSADLVTLGERPKFTEQQRVSQLIDVARESLTAPQLEALRLWLHDEDAAAIGVALGCSAEDADKIRRAGIARLRSHFGYEDLDAV